MGGHECLIVVIGLPRRQDRRDLIEAMLRRVPHANPLFAANLGLAVDWQNWTPEEIESLRARAFPWRNPDTPIRLWNRHLKLGEVACTLSHWNVWTFAAALDVERLIVLEDDAVLEPGFDDYAGLLERLEAQEPAWDLLYLGRSRVLADRGVVGSFTLPGYSYCTYGYAVSRRGLAKLLAADLQHSVIPVDEFLPAMYVEHPREDVRRRFQPTLSAYGLAVDVVRQQPKRQFGSDTEESPFLVPASDTAAASVQDT